MESVTVAIVGGGQAGLATSRELAKAGLEHVVLERGRVGETWRSRWDSFCLVTPNWSVQLPDGHYAGPEPDGFMPRDEFVAYLERYAAQSQVPIHEHVAVESVESLPGDGFVLRTSAGDIHTNAVVIATGAYQRPHRPAAARTLPTELAQIDLDDYRNEQALPPGKVLIIGSGQSPDLDQNVAWGDERYLQFRGLLDNLVSTRGLQPPALDDPEPFTSSAPNSIDPADIGSVIFAAGFRPDYRSWLPWPDAFDTWGFPLTQDGASTVVPGLYFVGVHFLRKRKSSLLTGVGEDAAIVVRQITKAYSVSR